jgi:hypothetical protein
MEMCMLKAYVRTLLDLGEQQPGDLSSSTAPAYAPGASRKRDRETHVNKSTWPKKWEACPAYFKCKPSGSMEMLKVAWKAEKRLREKQALTYS